MNRIDRLTAILIHLQSKRIVKAEEIARRFEISVRTVYRDVKALMEAGVPIGSEAGTGYFIVDGYHLPPVMFSREEASAILVAGKLVEKMTDESVRKSFESALMKIKSVLSDPEKDRLENLESYVEVFQFNRPNPLNFPNHFLTDIQNALVRKEALRLQYYSNHEQLTEREVEPIGILYYNSGWHLIGWCCVRNDYRDFRADRIKSLTTLTRKFDHHNLLSLHDYLKSYMQSHSGLEKVTLTMVKAFFKYRSYAHGYISEEDLGDRVRLTFLAEDLDRMARWLLPYGSAVEIEHPDRLRVLMAGRVEELHRHYSMFSEIRLPAENE
jgi:predicted DNA-binding transcriptional regulator YafY